MATTTTAPYRTAYPGGYVPDHYSRDIVRDDQIIATVSYLPRPLVLTEEDLSGVWRPYEVMGARGGCVEVPDMVTALDAAATMWDEFAD